MRRDSTVSDRDSTADTPLERNLNEPSYCAITGESRATARRNRMFGRGCAYIKLNGRVFYRPCDVRQYLASNRRATKEQS